MEILEVTWGTTDTFVDVTEKFINSYSKDALVHAENEFFSDPKPGHKKQLKIKYEKLNIIYNEVVFEGSFFCENKIVEIKQRLKEIDITQNEVYEYLSKWNDYTDLLKFHHTLAIINHTLKEAIIITIPFNAGLYSYVSIVLELMNVITNCFGYKIIKLFTQDGFSLYKDKKDDDVYQTLFSQNGKISTNKNKFLNDYFSPTDVVLNTIIMLKNKYKIDTNKCLGVYYRGTDKYTETTIPDPSLFLEKVKALNYDHILLQTDQTQVRDLFLNSLGNKCIVIDELPTSMGLIGIHLFQKSNQLKNAIEFNSVCRILSECKELVINPNSNVSQFILNIRDESLVTHYIPHKT